MTNTSMNCTLNPLIVVIPYEISLLYYLVRKEDYLHPNYIVIELFSFLDPSDWEIIIKFELSCTAKNVKHIIIN